MFFFLLILLSFDASSYRSIDSLMVMFVAVVFSFNTFFHLKQCGKTIAIPVETEDSNVADKGL